MNRRDFLKKTAAIAAATALPDIARAGEKLETIAAVADEESVGRLIISAPMLQNYAETSMGVAFAVSDMANGYVR